MGCVRWRVLAAGAIALGVVACSSGSGSKSTPASAGTRAGDNAHAAAVEWPAPPDPLERARAAGLVPETHESLRYHVHAHLDVFVDGGRVTVPGGIGIDTSNPAVRRGTLLGAPAFGGINPPCAQPCISPLHTHDVTGILHTESATVTDNTLGQFFVEWGQRLDASCVATYCRPTSPIEVFVDGKPFTADPSTIPLTDHKEIAIVIGRRPARVPATADFSLA